MNAVNESEPSRVAQLLELDVPIGIAVMVALHERDVADGVGAEDLRALDPKRSIARFIERYSLERTNTSAMLHGTSGRPVTVPVLDALVDRLGGTREWWLARYREAAWKLVDPSFRQAAVA